MGEYLKRKHAFKNTFIIPKKEDENRDFIKVNDDYTVTVDLEGYAIVPIEVAMEWVSESIADE